MVELRAAPTRRDFLWSALMTAAASCLAASPGFNTRVEAARAATPDLLHDTFNGLLAFIAPGSDEYSRAQGVSLPDQGGVAVGPPDVLIATLDESTPFVPQFSAVVASVVNGLAEVVNPSVGGAFLSPFANSSFTDKVGVFQIMDATESLKLLAGILPAFVAFFCYSEAAAYDPATRSLTGESIGWRLSQYQGVADGRDELVGYFPRSVPR